MPRYSRRKEERSFEDIARAILAILLLIALGIGGVSGFASALVGLVGILVTLAIAGGLIFFICKSRLVTRKKLGFSLIIVALLMGLYWNATRIPAQWSEIRASVMGPMGSGDARVVKINVGGILSPKFIDIRGTGTENLKSGDTISVWVNPVTRDEFSLTPQRTKERRSYWFPLFSCLVGIGGIGLLFVDKKWLDRSEPFSVLGPVPPDALGAELWARRSMGMDVAPHAPVVPSAPTVAERLAAIDWFQFEKVVKRILEADGWAVEHKGGAHADGGVDLLASKQERTAVVQCKHWHKFQVKEPVVRELHGAKNSAQFQGASEAMLFTLSDCTQPALVFAQQNNIEIFDGDYIRSRIAAIGVDSFPELLYPEIKYCPRCGAPMVWRTKAIKPFWGCSNYPRTHCHGKIEEN
jgi:hypothetical protein